MSSKKKMIARELTSLTERLFGLMFRKNPETVYFRTRFGIHTFFLNFPIDVLICDENYIVKKLKKGLRPNRFFFWKPFYDVVIEAPKGTINENKINIGDQLDLRV